MLNLSNNHFEFKSSVQLPKKTIFNLMGIKIAKNGMKYFSINSDSYEMPKTLK